MKKKTHNIRRVGLIGNCDKSACAAAVAQAAQLILASGREVLTEPTTLACTQIDAFACTNPDTLSREVDLLLVFGGDGTILQVARQTAGSNVPILGVNIGSLGFLTAVSSDEIAGALNQVWAGQFSFESRGLIRVTGRRLTRQVSCTALNDVVVSRGVASRLIELEVCINSELLTRYRCDGLIVSTPTGSTAYSLAAGGAVVFPTAQVIALTPICAHTLSNRALILPSHATIEVRVISLKPNTVLSADGQVVSELSAGDTITIRRSRRTIRLLHLAGSSFCDTLRRKLHWRGATI